MVQCFTAWTLTSSPASPGHSLKWLGVTSATVLWDDLFCCLSESQHLNTSQTMLHRQQENSSHWETSQPSLDSENVFLRKLVKFLTRHRGQLVVTCSNVRPLEFITWCFQNGNVPCSCSLLVLGFTPADPPNLQKQQEAIPDPANNWGMSPLYNVSDPNGSWRLSNRNICMFGKKHLILPRKNEIVRSLS